MLRYENRAQGKSRMAILPPEFDNLLLLTGDALIYFAALAVLLRARARIGLGAFFCALGVMHFLETYLASILYGTLPFGIVTSPGSTVLFTGKLMLVVGELDRNVDPASTLQVCNALIKANKDFDFLIVPGAGHGACESPYGQRRRADFFVRHLLGVEPRAK